MVRVCREESFHQRQGYDLMLQLARGSEAQRRMAQEALNRWWWPALMMFGPSDTEVQTQRPNRHAGKSSCFSNDELRQKFVDFTVPQADFLGLSIPDADLRRNQDTGHYEFGRIDWTEFNEILKGNGPCNAERIGARRKAHAEGAWVREAALAYAEKQQRRTAQSEVA